MYYCGECPDWPIRKRGIADGSRRTGHAPGQGAGLNRVVVLGWGPKNNVDSDKRDMAAAVVPSPTGSSHIAGMSN
jgi:hypothetical protein